MKQKLNFVLLFCSVIILCSFIVQRHSGDEDATAYVYAYISVKNPDYSHPASVFCPVFAITVKKDDFAEYAKFGTWALESKLRKYIEGVMGKTLISPTMTCCYSYADTRNKAEDERLDKIAGEKRRGNEILYTGVDFGFSWDWKEDMKD